MKRYPTFHRQQGFSLVEVLVGLVIGMIGMIVMLQVFSISEGTKRTTTGADDAQTSGAIGMYSLQRDLRQSGYNFSTNQLIGCSLQLINGALLPAIAPVLINSPIVPAGDTGSDTLLVMVGNGIGPPQGDQITSHPSATNFLMANPALFRVNDYVVPGKASHTSNCARQMDIVSSISGNSIYTQTGNTTVGASDWVVNAGSSPVINAYAVRNNRLTVCNFMLVNCATAALNDSNWLPIADNVVALRAQYGKTTGTGLPVSSWDQVTPLSTDPLSSWKNVIGLRVVLVARSAQYEKTEVTTAAPNWQASSTLPISLSAYADWKHYRYKTYETTVALRNNL